MNRAKDGRMMFLLPFKYIDGVKTLWLGLVFMLIGVVLSKSVMHRYDGFIDYHQIPIFKNAYLFDPFINWLLISSSTVLVGTLFKRSFRWIDVFGMYALAMAPVVCYPIFAMITGMDKLIIPDNNTLNVGELLSILEEHKLKLGIYALLQIGIIVWMIIWCYQVFKLNLNIKKVNDKLLFAVVFILVEVLSLVILRTY